jgi:hypothetical protein
MLRKDSHPVFSDLHPATRRREKIFLAAADFLLKCFAGITERLTGFSVDALGEF